MADDGRYSGWGTITVPYLADTNIRVEFDNIKINTDYQLVEGMVETSYDPNWSGVVDVDQAIIDIGNFVNAIYDTLEEALDALGIENEDYKEENVNFDIVDVTVNEEGETIVEGKNGEEQNLGVGNNTVVTDANGNTIVVNDEGKVAAVTNSDVDEETKDTPYYVTVDGRTQEYKYNDKMYFVRQKRPATLYLKTSIDSLGFASPIWKMGNKVVGEGDTISIDLKQLVTDNLNVEDAEDGSKSFKLKLEVYEKPIARFLLPTNSHNGEFLFDDAKYDKLTKAELYHEISDSIFHRDYAIGKNKKYFVPVIGVATNQVVQLKLSLDSWNNKDSEFLIKLKPTNGSLYLNGQETLLVRGNNSNINIQITSTLDYRVSPEFIKIYDHSDELIGKLEVYCEALKTKFLKFIYIKDENGKTNSLVDTSIMFDLNTRSHNQLFKEWINETTQVIHIDSLIKTYLKKYRQPTDSLSIVAARTNFKKNTPTIYNSYREYNNIADNDILTYTPIFLMPYDGHNSSGGLLGGFNWKSDRDEYRYTFVFKAGNTNTIFHEQGHDIGLPHTFCFDKTDEKNKDNCKSCVWPYGATIKNRNLPEKSTNNIMDYWSSSDKRIHFFKYQMLYLQN